MRYVLIACLLTCRYALSNDIGLSAYYGGPAEISACGLDADVHCCTSGSTGGVWECLWCYLGGVFESVCSCLVFLGWLPMALSLTLMFICIIMVR